MRKTIGLIIALLLLLPAIGTTYDLTEKPSSQSDSNHMESETTLPQSPSEHDHIESHSRSTTDIDNDGVLDEYDICPNGNGIVIISLDYFYTWEITDVGSYCDPYFIFFIDGNEDGYVDDNEWFGDERFYYQDEDELDGVGFDGGPLWHGVDVSDDNDYVLYGIAAFDRDLSENDPLDINNNSGSLYITGWFDISGSQNKIAYYNTSGYDDDDYEDDAYIEYHLEVIKGTSIESASPQPAELAQDDIEWMSIDEGEYQLFEIETVYEPYCIYADIGYEWYWYIYNDVTEEIDDYYCVKNYTGDGEGGYQEWVDTDEWEEQYGIPEQFELYANYNSAGKYFLVCYAFHDLMEDYHLYWYDYVIWALEINHVNTIPVANIQMDPEDGIAQLDTVSFSASDSYDIDGDVLTYTWKIDGVAIYNDITFNHRFLDAGKYTVELTVEDDEDGIDTSSKDISVNNYDTSSSSKDNGQIIPGTSITFDTVDENTISDRRSRSVTFDLIWGYSLEASATFVSDITVTHIGNATYDFIEKEDGLYCQLTETQDSYTIEYKPSIEFMIDLIYGGERENIFDYSLPMPLLNNNEDLDEDGQPLFTYKSLEIYTWDIPKVLYSNSKPLENSIDALKMEDVKINLAQIDIFEMAAALFNYVPTGVTIGIAKMINIIDLFCNLFLECNLNCDIKYQQTPLLIVDADDQEHNTIVNFESFNTEHKMYDTESSIYSVAQSDAHFDYSLSVNLHFNLTDWGQNIYGFFTDVAEQGLLVAMANSFMGFVTCDNTQKKNFEWIRTLWDSGTILSIMSGTSALSSSYTQYIPSVPDDDVETPDEPDDGDNITETPVNGTDGDNPLDNATSGVDVDKDGIPDAIDPDTVPGGGDDNSADGLPAGNNGTLSGEGDQQSSQGGLFGIEDEKTEDIVIILIVIIVGVIIISSTAAIVHVRKKKQRIRQSRSFHSRQPPPTQIPQLAQQPLTPWASPQASTPRPGTLPPAPGQTGMTGPGASSVGPQPIKPTLAPVPQKPSGTLPPPPPGGQNLLAQGPDIEGKIEDKPKTESKEENLDDIMEGLDDLFK